MGPSLNTYFNALLFPDSILCDTFMIVHLGAKKQKYHCLLCGFSGMHPKVYKTRSSTAIDRGKYMVWTSEMDNCLTDVLVEQVEKGNKVDNILKPAAFAAALKALNEKFGMHVTKGHIKNRLKTWRKQFGVLKELLAHRGFVWNKTQKMVVANDSVWNDYIRVMLLPVIQYAPINL
jgi:hypothetical protein